MSDVEARPIRTSYVFPPIPVRFFDWSAVRDGDEENPSLYGWGSTKEAAIGDLLRNEAEREDA